MCDLKVNPKRKGPAIVLERFAVIQLKLKGKPVRMK